MVHESVPTATSYAFGSHPRRVFSIRYLLPGFFHCGAFKMDRRYSEVDNPKNMLLKTKREIAWPLQISRSEFLGVEQTDYAYNARLLLLACSCASSGCPNLELTRAKRLHNMLANGY
jgi:hypothetical protein